LLNNLVSNAIRYQNPKAEAPFVDIDVTTSDDEAIISVKDNGIGISSENQPKVYDMFYRVSQNSVGSGLGLYIVKETIDKLQGKIEMDSELGKGTIFNIHIPNN
jgi:signal transduction histidine kinase